MNSTIMVERQAKALQVIAAEVERLGGRLEPATVRAPNPQVRQLLLLEAVAAALAGIGAPAGNVETEPVEAVIAVVKDAPAPKGKRKDN